MRFIFASHTKMCVCVCVCVCVCSVVSDSLQPSWTIAHQASLSMEFPRSEYWNRLPFLTPGNLPNPRIKPEPLMSPALDVNSISLAPLSQVGLTQKAAFPQ